MRAAALVFWALLVIALLVPVVRALSSPSRRRQPALDDELVKDPVCQVYVVRSRAVTASPRGEPVYFCSAECARRYTLSTGG